MDRKLDTIDPNKQSIPQDAIIQKVASENDRLPNGEHEKAVKAFYVSDSTASGISRDFVFVEKIPQFINEIIDNSSWECQYVSKSVVTPYYCRYTKGTDSENFRAFIAAKRPNGLGTTIETIDRLLEAELEVRNKFRSVIYDSRQGERTDLVDETCYSHYNKSEDSIGKIQKARIRAANRAAEAIPEIRELLDRGLIAIDIAAKLGRDIKDLDNLTAEEREYIDKRDLIGLRIKQYINTNTIPEDEDKELVYSRKLNEFVKDLLGIKDRSKSVRMDNPKKAAEKLLQFYEGQRLKELVEYLNQGLKKKSDLSLSEVKPIADENIQGNVTLSSETSNGKVFDKQSSSIIEEEKHIMVAKGNSQQSPQSQKISENKPEEKAVKPTEEISESSSNRVSSSNTFNKQLTKNELAERLGVTPNTIVNFLYKEKEKFTQWTQKKDPENIGWTRTQEKKGRNFLFAPVQQNHGHLTVSRHTSHPCPQKEETE